MAGALSSLVNKEVIWDLRIRFVQQHLLNNLTSFGIWSAGRDGKKFYRSLSPANQSKVSTFYEICDRKIKGGIYWDEPNRRKIPIVHFSQAAAPFLVFLYHPIKVLHAQTMLRSQLCVKFDLHQGFEENVASLGLLEGTDYWHFC